MVEAESLPGGILEREIAAISVAAAGPHGGASSIAGKIGSAPETAMIGRLYLRAGCAGSAQGQSKDGGGAWVGPDAADSLPVPTDMALS